jgi:hypothetical protein
MRTKGVLPRRGESPDLASSLRTSQANEPQSAGEDWGLCTRRRCLSGLALASATSVTGCRTRHARLGGRLDEALATAIRYLIAAQSADGSWRSRTYGALKDGASLTPAVLKAITFAPDQPGSAEARLRGATYLGGLAHALKQDAGRAPELIYPVYTASAALIVSSRVEGDRGQAAREVWLRELRRRQMTEELGWTPLDPSYGAWGYSLEPLRKPHALGSDQPLDADLSSTLFAVGALRIIGVAADAPEIRKAIVFIQRCQNVAAEGGIYDPRYDDGGFFLTPTDPVRNKAGGIGTSRYHSYGSATADGLRALLRCGLAVDHPRVAAARTWLQTHFSVLKHPGECEPGRELDLEATYYYFTWSASHAFRALGVREFQVNGRLIAWAEGLAQELMRRQHMVEPGDGLEGRRPFGRDGTRGRGPRTLSRHDPGLNRPLVCCPPALSRLQWSIARRGIRV